MKNYCKDQRCKRDCTQKNICCETVKGKKRQNIYLKMEKRKIESLICDHNIYILH